MAYLSQVNYCPCVYSPSAAGAITNRAAETRHVRQA